MIKNIPLKLQIFVLSLCVSLPSYSRWAGLDDASVEVKFYNTDIQIYENGTSENVVEMRAKILKEPGRSYASNYTLFYKEDSTEVKIIEAKTIYNGKEYHLTVDMIEDKPLASSQHGFDQERQILLSFPKAEIGAEIYLKYVSKELQPVLDNFFSDRLSYGLNGYLHASTITINSELPLYMKINDPDNILEIIKDENEDKEEEEAFLNLSVTLTKPVYAAVVNEAANSVINNKYLTWISFSSMADWKDLAIKLSSNYEKVINQELPEILQQIIEASKDIKNEEEQIDTVTSLLNERIQYMGDWRSVAGRYFPRDLSVIVASHVGDCKDFSTMTAALLQKLGYKTQVALVFRGEGRQSFENGMPDIGDFNHAFVKVTTKDGKLYWIDPTNSRSMASGVFPDVAGKMALVLDSQNPEYVRDASIDPKHSVIALNKKLTIMEGNVINTGDLTLKGESALPLSGAGLYSSEKLIADHLFYFLSEKHLDEQDKLELVLPNLRSRIVRDINIPFKYNNNSQLIKTNLAPAVTIGFNLIENIASASPDQVSDLVIGPQSTIKRQIVIENKKIQKIETLNYSRTTPWLDVNRSCKLEGNNTVVDDEIIIKRMFIPREDLVGEEYKNLREELLQNYKHSAVI